MEKEFIEWLRQHRRQLPEEVVVAIGDDAAVIKPTDSPFIVACDSIADGTHFDTTIHTLKQIGRKSIAVNLSDIAAMGGKPSYVTLSFFLPNDYTLNQAKELFEGAAEMAERYGAVIVGGDTNSWQGNLVVGATVIGQTTNPAWQMNGAQPGDAIVVTGQYGGSILGHHINFEPRCNLAEHFSGRYRINAATDVTDSLSYDLHQMCELSGCGADIELEKIPLRPAAHELAKQKKGFSALEHALYDGEDFELIFAIPADQVDRIMNDDRYGRELTVIGQFRDGMSVASVNNNGTTSPVAVKGYTH